MASAGPRAARRFAPALGVGFAVALLAACSSTGTAQPETGRSLVVTTAVGTDYGDGTTTTATTAPTTTTALVLPAPVLSSPAVRPTSGKRPRKRAARAPGPSAVGPATAVRWAVKPAQITLAPGAHVSGLVVAKNLGSAPGWIAAPGCAGGPRPAARQAAKLCAPAGTPTRVEAGRSRTWEWTWNATADGRRGSAPLVPGNYSFLIGGATVQVTVA